MPRVAAPLPPPVRSDAEVEALVRSSWHLAEITTQRMITSPQLIPFRDDLKSAALVALWKAARIWTEDRSGGRAFVPFAVYCMKNAIRDEIRIMTHRGKRPLPYYLADLGSPKFSDDSFEMSLPSDDPSPDSDYQHSEDADELVDAMAKLDDRHLDVVTRYYFENMTLAEIGRARGISESRVSQLLAESEGLLKTHILAERYTENVADRMAERVAGRVAERREVGVA